MEYSASITDVAAAPDASDAVAAAAAAAVAATAAALYDDERYHGTPGNSTHHKYRISYLKCHKI